MIPTEETKALGVELS